MAVYVIGATGTSLVKIGYTGKPVTERLSLLQVGCPTELVLWGAWYSMGKRHEAAIHRLFRDRRVRGEWFDMSGPIGLALYRLLDDESHRTGRTESETLSFHNLAHPWLWASGRFPLDDWEWCIGRWSRVLHPMSRGDGSYNPIPYGF